MVLRKPSGGGYIIYKGGREDLPIRTEDVTLVHPTKDASQLTFAEDDSDDWEGVTSATRAASNPGVDYRSPGYAATAPP